MSTTACFKRAIESFDHENAEDPHQEIVDGVSFPKELLYAQRLTDCLSAYAPDASEVLQLAARSQHIRRWEIPRTNYPSGKKGYLLWRKKLMEMHAQIAGDIMHAVGYDIAAIQNVRKILQKQELKTDPEVQTLQDAVCLVFLEYYFKEFSINHSAEKIKDILEKTIRKMSEKGVAYAKNLSNSQEFLAFLD